MSPECALDALPWAPLFSVTRSGQTELTLYGIASVWQPAQSAFPGPGRELLAIGDVSTPMWTRSLLKPWQLLNLLPTLRNAYPALSDRHLAVMLSSHQGEPEQAALVSEALALLKPGLPEELLQCPACYPMAPDAAADAKRQNHPQSRVFYPCSGKHAAHLLALAAKNLPLSGYMDPSQPDYQRLQGLLSTLPGKAESTLPETIDGCGMPNYALSVREIACLFAGLPQPLSPTFAAEAEPELQATLSHWPDISCLMTSYPLLVGGTGRLDSRLMLGELQSQPVSIIAKEGADGLLGVGVGPCAACPNGLGIAVKLSSGYEPKHLETVITGIFEQLGLRDPLPPSARGAHLRTHLHFQVAQPYSEQEQAPC